MRVVAVIIVLVLLVQTGAARGDTGWMGPEGFLYPLKVWMEKFSLNLIFNQTEKDQKMLDLAEERLNEAEEMGNNSRAFERAMEEYADQLEELQGIIEKDASNNTTNVQANIKERIENHKNRTKSLKGTGKVSIIQQSIIEASSGESKIEVSAVNGNVSVHTEGGNATITRDGNNVTVISVTNNSRQKVVVRTSSNTSSSSSSSSSVVVQSSSSVVSGN